MRVLFSASARTFLSIGSVKVKNLPAEYLERKSVNSCYAAVSLNQGVSYQDRIHGFFCSSSLILVYRALKPSAGFLLPAGPAGCLP